MALDYLIRLSGRNVEDLSFEVASPVPRPYPALSRELLGIPGRIGVVPSRVGVGRPRSLDLVFYLDTDIAIEDRQDAVDEFTGWVLRPGLTEIRFGTQPDRVWWGLLENVTVRPRWDRMAWILGPVTATLRYTIPDGVALGTHLNSLGLFADRWTDIAGMGNAPSDCIIFMEGGTAVIDPVVEVATPDNEVVTKLTLDGTVPNNRWWEVDTYTRRIVEANGSNGTRTDVTDDVYDSGDWPVLDPALGSESMLPRMRSSEECVVYYRAHWKV